MRVLFPFVGDSYGGSHVSALTLIEQLRKKHGVDVVIGLHEAGYFTSILDERGIEWQMLPAIKYARASKLPVQILKMIFCIKVLSKYLKKTDIDIVHTNDLRMHLSWVWAAKYSKVSHIWHQRGPVNSNRISVYMLFSSAVITISKYCKQSFSRYAKRRAVIVDNPVCFSAANGSSEIINTFFDKVGPASKKNKNVLFVGNWLERKRPLTFVQAAKYVVNEISNIVFTMVGEERQPMQSIVRDEIKKLGLEDNFILAGAQSYVDPWYNSADILVAPAVGEGLGRTLIEASILGVPVIASRHGGHIEILEEGVTGLFFEPNDPEDLANKIINAFAHNIRTKKMANMAQQSCLERFSPSAHAEKVYLLYESVLSKS